MPRLAVRLPFLLLPLAGCTDREPLAPAFAGEWASRRIGCDGPRIVIGRSGISAPGMPVNGLSFTSAEVSGRTAHLVMELGPAAKLAAGQLDWGKSRDAEDPRDFEILATLVVSGDLVNPNNVMLRHRKTRQLRVVPPDILAILALRRCGEQDGQGASGARRAGQRQMPKP